MNTRIQELEEELARLKKEEKASKGLFLRDAYQEIVYAFNEHPRYRELVDRWNLIRRQITVDIKVTIDISLDPEDPREILIEDNTNEGIQACLKDMGTLAETKRVFREEYKAWKKEAIGVLREVAKECGVTQKVTESEFRYFVHECNILSLW